MRQGYIWLWRTLLDKPIWKKSTPEQKTVLITILLLANHSTEEWEWGGEKFKVEPGQFITSLDSLVKACGTGVSTQNVRGAIAKFEKLNFLTNKSTKTGRLITIIKWASYQHPLSNGNKEDNKEVTKTQQRGNKEVTPNKEGKEGKEGEEGKNVSPLNPLGGDIKQKDIIKKFIPPTPDEVEKYGQEIGFEINGEHFCDFYTSKGWFIGKNKMKDWKAAVRTWRRKAVEDGKIKAEEDDPWADLRPDDDYPYTMIKK